MSPKLVEKADLTVGCRDLSHVLAMLYLRYHLDIEQAKLAKQVWRYRFGSY